MPCWPVGSAAAWVERVGRWPPVCRSATRRGTLSAPRSRSRTSGDGTPWGTAVTKLPRTERVPTRGQSTDGPIVMGWTQHDDGMEHAWSPRTSAAGRRLRPLNRTGAPSRRGTVAGVWRPASGAAGPAAVQVASRQRSGGGRQTLNLLVETFGFRAFQDSLRTISVCRSRGLAPGACHGTRWAHSLPFGVERTADRLLPPGARLADGPGCPPDRGRPMSGCQVRVPGAGRRPGRGGPAVHRGRPMSGARSGSGCVAVAPVAGAPPSTGAVPCPVPGGVRRGVAPVAGPGRPQG